MSYIEYNYRDATPYCTQIVMVVDLLERLLERHGVPQAGVVQQRRIDELIRCDKADNDVSLWLSAVNCVCNKEPMQAVVCFAAYLRWTMLHARDMASYQEGDRDSVLYLDECGAIVGEIEILQRTLCPLAKVLDWLGEADMVAGVFQSIFTSDFKWREVSRILPVLLKSKNHDAINTAIDVIRVNEPFSHEVAQGKARLSQLDADERSVSIDSMTGSEFETLLGDYFSEFGFVVNIIGDAGDYGVDLCLRSYDGTVIAIQAKRWKAKINLKAV